MASRSVEPTRALVSGRQSLGRTPLAATESARSAGRHKKIFSTNSRLHCSRSACDSKLRPPPRVSHRTVSRGPWVSVMIVRCPSDEETTQQSNPSSRARRVLEKSTVNSDLRKLPLPDTRCPSQAARKPQQTPPSASSIEIDVSREDFAAMTNLARTTAETMLRTLEASIGSLFSRVALAQLFRKANPLAAPDSDPRGSSSS